MRLHHVNVVVPPGRTEAVVPFYEALGATRVAKANRRPGAWFDLPGGTQVHVSEREGAVHPEAHFALVVDDFDGLVARLVADGHPWTDAEPQDGARRGRTADPAGNAVELLEPTGPFSTEGAQ